MSVSKSRKPKLAVFDVEGVLIPKNRFFFEVAKSLGALPLLKVLFYGFLYEIGLVPLKKTLTHVFSILRGVKVSFLEEKLSKLSLTPSAPEVFAALRAEGCKTALISSGLPTFLVEKLARLVGADYAVGVEVGVSDGVLTGEAWGDVTESRGKFLVLKELMEDQQATLADCVVVADDRNNVSIFQEDIQKIGFNPDFVMRMKADVVVSGRLTKILPIINQTQEAKSFPSRNDVVREVIHGSGIFIPVLAGVFGVVSVGAFICVVLALYSISEYARMRGRNLPFFSTVTRLAASQSELCQFALAPVYFGLGIFFTLVLFPAPASSAAIAIFTIGDSTASLIGPALAKRPLPFNRAKTVEGTLGGFFFAFLAASLFVSPWIALVGAVLGMLVEYLPLPINDNLLMPIITGLALTFLI